MNKTGFSRPGALQMLFSATLLVLAGIAPTVLAARQPSQEWQMISTGLPALLLTLAGIFLVVLYFIGFLRYCSSKGFSKWLGFWLFLGQFPGFIALLLLPDLIMRARTVQAVTRPAEVTGFR